MAVIHFNSAIINRNLYYLDGNFESPYLFDSSYNLCAHYAQTLNITGIPKDVSCESCIKIMTCDHEYRIMMSRSHVSCVKCDAVFYVICSTTFLNGTYAERLMTLSKNDDEKERLIFNNFKLFNWL